MDGFEEIKDLVMQYLRGVWRNRWIAIAIAWPVLIAGVLVVDQMKDRYKAETKVFIDTTSVLKPLLRGLAIQSDIQSSLQLMVRKLLSRPNLERSIRLMDMDLQVQSSQDMEKLIEKVRERVHIDTKRNTNTYTISYQDENPVQAKKMVQTLLDIFVEDTLGKSVQESDTAILFLDNQIEKYDRLLQEAEQRLEAFKRKNVGVMPDDGGNYYAKYQQMTANLESANLQLAESINRRDKLRSQLSGVTLAEVQVSSESNYDPRIREQEARLDDLLLAYTEEHPEVINTRRVLGSLLKRKELEQAESVKSAAAPSVDNPVYQQLQILVSETEANISSLNARVASYSSSQQKLKELVDVVPRIEAELKRLNRDYEVHKKNYSEMVSRREQAKISEDVETGTEQVKFRVIEPPRVPLKADFPNRPLFDLTALVLALGIGYGVGLLISLSQPIIYNSHELKKLTELPILGAVSKFDTAEVLAQRRRNLFLFVLANISLVSMALVFVVLHRNDILVVGFMKQMVLGA